MRMPRIYKGWVLATVLASALLLVGGGVSHAVMIGFNPITSNDPCNPQLVAPQLFMDVFNGAGIAKFTFYNLGPVDCSITDIYFDDGTLLGISQLHDYDDPLGGPYGDPCVDFSKGASPGNLPGASNDPCSPYYFIADQQFNVDSDPPTAPWGVEPGQVLQIDFVLDPCGTLADVLQELNTRDLKVGIHVQSIDGPLGGSSESFINIPVPEPATLFLLGLGGTAVLRKRKRRA